MQSYVTYYTNRMKDTNHMIISIVAEKALENNSREFMTKTLKQVVTK